MTRILACVHHLFESAGYDVQTVRQESLQGATDGQIYEACCQEGRCLVTLDLDFADVLRFPPQKTGGIVVIRVSRNPSRSLLETMVTQFLQTVRQMSVYKQLWIVEIGRIRIHQAETDAEV